MTRKKEEAEKKRPGQKPGQRIGGRQKGTPNVVTAGTRQAICRAWEEYVSTGRFETDLEALSEYDRLVLMERLANYTVPKLKSIDLDAKVSTQVTIEERLRQLSGEDEE